MSNRYPELLKLQQMAVAGINDYCKQLRRENDPVSPFHAYAQDLESLGRMPNRSASSFTCQNPNYWRVLMVPERGYETALLINAYVYAAFKQISWSKIWLFLAHLDLTEEVRPAFDSLWNMIRLAEDRIAEDIQEGIKLHDQGRFNRAIEIYDRILAEYPYSAWARYEKSYSLVSADPTGNQEIAENLCEEALQHDPFYPQAYIAKSPDEIEVFNSEVQPFLYTSLKDKIGFRTFAYGCHKLGLYEIAGHAMFQLLSQYPHDQDLAFRFIVCLTEYGVDALAREITPILLKDNNSQTQRTNRSEDISKIKHHIKELFVSGNYREAHKAALQGLEYASNQFGAESLEAAQFLYDVGNGFLHLGNAETAERYIQSAIRIYERELEPDDIDVGYAFNSLAAIYMQLGQVAEAEICLRRVVAIWETKLSLRDCTLALAYHNLGVVLMDQGRETEARPNIQRALYILENTSVPPQYETAPSLFRLTLAKIERQLGNFSEAIEIATEAKEIIKSKCPANHPDAIQAEKALADIYRDEGKFSEYADHLKTVLESQRKVYGPEHPEVAYTLNNLGQSYEHLGLIQKSEELYSKSLEMRKKLLGNGHPALATPLNNLALLYARQNRLLESQQLLQQALEIRERTLPSNHPDLVQTIHNLAIVEIALRNFDNALVLLRHALQLDEQLMNYRTRGSSEVEKVLSFGLIGQRFEILLSLVCQYMADSKDALNVAFEAVTMRKGLMVETLANERTILKANNDLFKKLRDTTNQMASLAIGGPRSLPLNMYFYSWQELRDRLDKIEVELSAGNDQTTDTAFDQEPILTRILDSLPADTVLIEYVACPLVDFTDLDFGDEARPIHYLAFVVRGGTSPETFLVDLGSAQETDKLIKQYRSELELVALRPLSPQTEFNSEKNFSDVARAIYRRIFAPLEPAIRDAKTIYIAPDRELNSIAFSTLKNDEDMYLIEYYQFAYLITAKNLLRFRSSSGLSKGVFVFADPDYDLTPFEPIEETELPPSDATSLSAFFRVHRWNRLAGTREEALAIAEHLSENQVFVFLSENAREDIVKQLSSPQILHLATHGFFLHDEYLDTGFPALISKRELFDDPSESPDKTVLIQFPTLLRSGLVFAGANLASRCPISGDVDDGILTALEVSALKLWDTDLVVLSACETGLGDTNFSEGVIGLRRAFQVAGVQTLITSLWPVPDNDTIALMTAFYRHIRKGSGRANALQEAAIEVLKARREQFGNAHPFYWGAFICIGNPASITLNS
jgi:CHAT domain-containing protein/Tfp pilus assembly protein PilF